MGKKLFAIWMVALTITYSVFAIVIINQKETIKEKDIQISELQSEKVKLQSKYDSVYNENTELEYEVDEMESEYNFFHLLVVICDDTSDYYHKYDCDNWNRNSFYLYNRDNAISLGYSPCPNCH